MAGRKSEWQVSPVRDDRHVFRPLRDLAFPSQHPVLKHWAIFFRPCGTLELAVVRSMATRNEKAVSAD